MILAIDLGGTNIQYALFKDQEPLWVKSTETKKQFISQLQEIILSVVNAGAGKVDVIALGVPGPVDGNTMQGSRPLNYTDDLDFADVLGQFGISFIVANDLQMAVYCELYRGAGLSYKNFCLVSLSTGIGVGIVNEGRILKGRIEMGHQVLRADFKPPQPCTNHSNCWASLASGGAIESRFGNQQYSDTEAIFSNLLTANDVDEIRDINAQAFGNLINAYDPQVIVMMGSLGINQFERIIPAAKLIEPFTINRPVPPIIKTAFDSHIGVLGAYHAALDYLKNNPGN